MNLNDYKIIFASVFLVLVLVGFADIEYGD